MTETLEIGAQLHEKWLIFSWALGIGLLLLAIGWRQGLFQPFKKSHLPHIKGRDILKGFGLFLFVELFLIPIAVGLFFSSSKNEVILTPQMKGLFNFLMILGGFGAVLLAYFQLTLMQRQQLWYQTAESWLHHVGIGITFWFISFPIVLAFNQLLSILIWVFFHHPFIEQSVVISLRNMMENPLIFGATGVAIVTLVPLTEEFLFRGLLQNWLKGKFRGLIVPIGLSSFVFALFHYTSDQGITNIELLSSLFLLSCVLGYIYERQRSLWAPIGLHSFFNFISLLMIFKEPSEV